ncbi:MAG: InlB B-repeat-containing protein [Candidatus Aenigmatarchaeota archaeon]
MLKLKYFYFYLGIITVSAILLLSSKTYAGCCTTTDTGNCGDRFCTLGFCTDCGLFMCTVFGPCNWWERLKVNYVGTCNGEYYSCPWSGVYPYCVCDKSCGATCCSDSDCGECGSCSPPYCNVNSSKCPATDTDGGKDYLTKGTCSYRYCDYPSYSCAVSATITDSCVGDTLWEYYPGSSSGPNYCGSEKKNCNDYDCTTGLASTCSVSGSSLTRSGDDYSCSNGACAKVGTKTCESYTCSASNECGSQSCAGINYKCYRSNAGAWVWGSSAESKETACNDGYDNDCDGNVDSKDPDCPVSITVTSNPNGSSFVSVDSVPITTPQTYAWQVGSTHTLSANSPVTTQPALRFIFSSWSDGGAQTHTITVPSTSTTYTANYNPQIYLATQANPSSGGTVSGSGWYDLGSSVTIRATANTCYVFKNWTTNWNGGYNGTANPASVSIDTKAFVFAAKGNTPTETANFDYNNGASCGTQHCSNSATHSAGDDCTDITCKYRHYGVCSSGSCVYNSENCDNYDSNYCTCTIYTSKLREECRDYECIPLFGNTCSWTGDWILKNEWTCDSSKQNTKQTCRGTDYWCCYDNGYKWQSTPCGTCSYSLSIDPSSGSFTDSTKTWSISATDNSNNYCTSPITYSISYSTSGDCESSNTNVNPTSFSINRGSTLSNAFSVKVTAITGSSCTLELNLKDPNGKIVSSGSYTVSSQVSCVPGEVCDSNCDGTCKRKVYVYDSSCNCVYDHTENCPADTSCSAGQCLSSVACLTQNECKDSCTIGQKQYRCDGSGNCNNFWQWANTQSCNPFGCSGGSCTNLCSQNCGADPECDGKTVGSACGIGGSCDASCRCVGSAQVNFDAWLGIKELSATLGQTFPVSIYVKNKGSDKDNYNFEVKTSSSNVQAKLYDSKISNVLPSSIVSTKVEIKLVAVSSKEEVNITVSSEADPGKRKELSIIIKIGSGSMDDLDIFSIVLLIGIATVIFLAKKTVISL